jgi:hypothetical protein
MSDVKIIRFDWAMKNILRNKANYDIVEGFLCALLNDDEIKVIDLLESESNQEDESDKFNRVDVLVKDNQQRNIIIEIQSTRESDYLYRILYGTAKNIAQSIDLGHAYKNINKVISVSVLYFNLGIGNDYLYYGSTEFTGLNTNERISKLSPQAKKLLPKGATYNGIEIYPEYYLIQVEKYKNIIGHAIDEWIYWFKNEKIKDGSKSKNIKKVEEKLSYLKMSPEDQAKYNRYQENLARERDILETAKEEGKGEGEKIGVEKGEKIGIEKGEKIGIEKGEKIGVEKGEKIGELRNQIKTALEMIKENMEDQLIHKFTGLPVETIAQIRQFWKEKPDTTPEEVIDKLYS